MVCLYCKLCNVRQLKMGDFRRKSNSDYEERKLTYPFDSAQGLSCFGLFDFGSSCPFDTVIMLETCPYRETCSAFEWTSTPSSNMVIKCCGMELSGSQVALSSGHPSQRTYTGKQKRF